MSDRGKSWLTAMGVLGLLVAGGVWYFRPVVPSPGTDTSTEAVATHAHAHGSPHGGTPVSTLSLSEEARQNLQLRTEKIALADHWRSLTIPAEVIEEPGHCEQRITTPLDGIVRRIYILKGQTVYPGDPLFDLQLTGGPLADAQASLLKTVQDLELVTAELARIKPLADQGTIPPRELLAKQFEQKRLEILQHTEREELLIRGLTQDQVAAIQKSKTLLREFTVRVPQPQNHESDSHDEPHQDEGESTANLVKPTGLTDYTQHAHGTVFTVETIDVVLGELVRTGDRLGELALHTMLLIEGRAFEREATAVERAMQNKWPLEAYFETGDQQPLVRKNLTVLSIENALDAAGRTLKFYLPLENEVLMDREVANGVSYRNWRFRPGQKVRLLLPVEHLENRIVLPLDAVVREGADAYVFRMNGKLLERVPVVIEHQDMTNVILGRGSKIRDGDYLAMNQAYQLNLMLKQAEAPAGGDPHAGHSH